MPWLLLCLIPPGLIGAYVLWSRSRGVKPHKTIAEHMAWEEEILAPKLPKSEREWLFAAHKFLREKGDPPELVARHATAEEARLQSHLSAAEFAQLQCDHAWLLSRRT